MSHRHRAITWTNGITNKSTEPVMKYSVITFSPVLEILLDVIIMVSMSGIGLDFYQLKCYGDAWCYCASWYQVISCGNAGKCILEKILTADVVLDSLAVTGNTCWSVLSVMQQ